ncbi:hypothetical protein PF008_g10369 [Phytophthora fragariae]|uniref:CCHC-type domain-containing protein n=1 Tax=Phytophthora fragariae TaxID=53985 RepID=A0A6G0RU34_9STRA|nr:hypothetical protein PF008_g10369 [Phytophthora fragariae]
MLSLSLLARAAAARKPTASRCVSIVSRSLGSNAAVVPAPRARFEAPYSRLFSTVDGPKDDDSDDLQDDTQDQPINGEMSPLQRLMQHSQKFQLDQDLEDDAGHAQHEQDQDKDQDAQDDGPFARTWQSESPSSSKSSDSNKPSGRPAAAFRRDTFRRRGSSDRQWQLGRMAVNHLLEKDMDELDYDAELESVWGERELKQRKFHQQLRREQDRDHVCQNCGERGHRSRNCLVPLICSNCGNLGHSVHQCRFVRSPDSIDELVEREEHFQKKQKKTRTYRRKAAKAAADPGVPRPEGMPMSDFNRRNDIMREELEAELEAYADILEKKDRVRKKKKTQDRNATTPSEK